MSTIDGNYSDIFLYFITHRSRLNTVVDYKAFGIFVPILTGAEQDKIMSNIDSVSSATPERLQNSDLSTDDKNAFEFVTATFKFLRDHLFTISVIAALLFGWANRDDNYLSAENGIGYALGIIGGSLMLLVILYPLSKRLPLLSRWIAVRHWFFIHMLFGIVGPVMILFHSNFHLGSTNSTIALISMLVVAFSGLIARYIYAHIHHGLYGRRITLDELKYELETKHTALFRIYEMDEKLKQQITRMETIALSEYNDVGTSLVYVVSMAIDARRLKYRSMHVVKKSKKDASAPAELDNKVTKDFIQRYTVALRRIARFRLFERLFSLWHVMHMPLFIMMIITAVIHIFAVHLY
jgi:hypothetical protein